MTPDQLRIILATFNLTQRDLAKAMNVSPPTVARWEDGSNTPTGLQDEVLRALHSVALQVKNDEAKRQVIAGMIGLGIGALIAYLLIQKGTA